MKWQVCYARTHDGIHFERPDLGIVPDAKSPNVLIDNGGIFSVMRNDAAVPERRYAMVHTGWGPVFAEEPAVWLSPGSQRRRSLLPRRSALARVGAWPGLPRWQRRLLRDLRPPQPKIPLLSGRPAPISLCVPRQASAPKTPAANDACWPSRSSDDGVHWSRLENFIEPDADDPPELELYMFTVFPYRDRFVGLMRNYARSRAHDRRTRPHIAYEWWVSPRWIPLAAPGARDARRRLYHLHTLCRRGSPVLPRIQHHVALQHPDRPHHLGRSTVRTRSVPRHCLRCRSAP